MEKKERDQLLAQISELKRQWQVFESLDTFEERSSLYKEIRSNTTNVRDNFHKLFHSSLLRLHLERMLKLNDELTIGPILDNPPVKLEHFIDALDRLLEIDRLLQEFRLDYLFHFEERFDEGTSYILYLGNSCIVKEWWATYDDYVENCEYEPFMHIPPFLRYGASFLEKHKDNPGLIEIFASEF